MLAALRWFLASLLAEGGWGGGRAAAVAPCVALSRDATVLAGLDEAAARRAAAVELGGSEQVKVQVREIRLGHFLETRGHDLRFAFRSLRRSPVFSLTVGSVLALGIGSTALIFTLVPSVLIVGPPFPQAQRLFLPW